MAVDPAGNAYLAGTGFVAKLNAAGTALVYNVPIPHTLLQSVAVDSMGRAYVLGATQSGATIQTTAGAFQETVPDSQANHIFVIRLNQSGDAFDYAAYVTGTSGDGPFFIGVDASGAAVLTGFTYSTDFPTTPGAHISPFQPGSTATFLARLNPDGSGLVYSTYLNLSDITALAVDSSGGATVIEQTNTGQTIPMPASKPQSNTILEHFSPAGALSFSKNLPGVAAIAADSAGNIYAAGSTNQPNLLTAGLSTCGPLGSAYLMVLDQAGDTVEKTYLSEGSQNAIDMAVGSGPTVYMVGWPNYLYQPTQENPAFANGEDFLARLSPQPTARSLQLVCIGNSASYDPGGIAPGELVSLFGNSLGPANGVQPQLDSSGTFPSEAAGVQVTFDGIAAPLLYVQDGQINAIVPWSMAGLPAAAICVYYNGAKTNCLSRAVADAAPGVFTTDGYYAAALNQDGTINSASSPALAGTVVSVFPTGLGPLSPPKRDGAIILPPWPANTLEWQVYEGLMDEPLSYTPFPAPTLYAGPAPYLVGGVSQVNVQIYPFVPLTLTSGPYSSPWFGIYIGPQ